MICKLNTYLNLFKTSAIYFIVRNYVNYFSMLIVCQNKGKKMYKKSDCHATVMYRLQVYNFYVIFYDSII